MQTKDIGQEWIKIFKKLDNPYKTEFNSLNTFLFKNSQTISNIRKKIPIRGKTILEAGCGSGKISLILSLLGGKVTALDISEEMLKNVREMKKGCPKKIHLNTLQGDLVQLDINDNSFDIVLNDGVVEHWLDKEERVSIIKEMARVTKKNGHVVIIVPNGSHPYHKKWEKTKYTGYTTSPPMTIYSMKKLKKEFIEAGLKPIYSQGLDPLKGFNQWPRRRILTYPIFLLNELIPFSRKFREKWGIHLLCIGVKK